MENPLVSFADGLYYYADKQTEMADFEINEEALVAYLSGELDAAQRAAVEAWYDASPANRRLLGEIYRILYVNDRINDAARIDVEKALNRCRQRLHGRARRTMWHRGLLRVAAAAAVIVVLLTGGWSVASVAERLTRPMTVYTQLGERSQAVLPDGTKVWLNSSSRVEYAASFFSRKRRVKMEGEAYFEVAHDKHAPFVVSTNGLDVRVLGTRFNIRSNTERHLVTTVLLEGSVEASVTGQTGNSVRLRPSQQLVFDTDTKSMLLSDIPTAERSINWIFGRFSFEHNTLEEIAEELNRYYNVDIRFKDDSLRRMRFSGDFQAEDGIYHIMSVLQLTYKFNYRIVDNDIEIYANTDF